MTCLLGQILNPRLTCFLGRWEYVLKSLNMITLHYGGLDVFFNVYDLLLNSSNLKSVREEGINSQQLQRVITPTARKSTVVPNEPIYCIGGYRIIWYYPFSPHSVGSFLPLSSFACVIAPTS